MAARAGRRVQIAAGVCLVGIIAARAGGGQRSTRAAPRVTIEALQDVRAEIVEGPRQQRGVLYVTAAAPFTIKRGQRFVMVKAYSEGGCRIRVSNREYDVSSCPWLDGFADPQADIFKVVGRR
jgi:hypothetical protein